MEPENTPLEEENHLPSNHFQLLWVYPSKFHPTQSLDLPRDTSGKRREMSMQWIHHHRKLHKRHLKHRWQWQVSLTWTQKRAEELDFMPEFLPSKNIHLSLSRGWANLIQQFTETHCVSMYRALISIASSVWNLIELTGLGNSWMVKTPVDLTYDGPLWECHGISCTIHVPIQPIHHLIRYALCSMSFLDMAHD